MRVCENVLLHTLYYTILYTHVVILQNNNKVHYILVSKKVEGKNTEPVRRVMLAVAPSEYI